MNVGDFCIIYKCVLDVVEFSDLAQLPCLQDVEDTRELGVFPHLSMGLLKILVVDRIKLG